MHSQSSQNSQSEDFNVDIPQVFIQKFNDQSAISNNVSSQHQIDSNKAILFQQYLDRDMKSPRNCQRTSSNEQEYDSRTSQASKNLIIEIGQNYTFADPKSSSNKMMTTLKQRYNHAQQKGFNVRQYLQEQKRLQLQKQIQDQSDPSRKWINPRQPSLKSNQKSLQIQDDSKSISLSDSQEEFGKKMFEEKQLQQEMFLKISQQANFIIKLEQKNYYYQDFCKKLLKSQQTLKQNLKKVSKELKSTKKTIKSKDSTIKSLQQKLAIKQRQIQTLIKENKSLLMLKNSNAKQNIKNVKQDLQKRVLNDKLNSLAQNRQFDDRRWQLLQKQNIQLSKGYQQLKVKNKNLANINKILEKQVQQTNIKILQLENQIQNNDYGTYIEKIARLKNNYDTNYVNREKQGNSKFSKTLINPHSTLG